MYYYAFRFYDPNLQRWINAIRLESGRAQSVWVRRDNPNNSLNDPLGLLDGNASNDNFFGKGIRTNEPRHDMPSQGDADCVQNPPAEINNAFAHICII